MKVVGIWNFEKLEFTFWLRSSTGYLSADRQGISDFNNK